MNAKLIGRIEEIFYEKLSTKTGWGRNDIKVIYKESVNEALLEIVDQNSEKN